MAFSVKDWKDYPDTSTPINQTSLEDLETRLSSYTDLAAPPVTDVLQAGAFSSGDVALTRDSSTQVTIAAGVVYVTNASSILVRTAPTSTVISSYPAATTGRLDQIVISSAGVVTRLAGTTDSGAVTLDNRTGAASIPSGSKLLHDIFVTSSGVLAANCRDRRSWARGFYYTVLLGSQTRTGASPTVQLLVGTRIRVECSGKPIHFSLNGRADSNSTWSAQRLYMEGVDAGLAECDITGGAPSSGNGALFEGTFTPSAGSHLFEIQTTNGGGSLSCAYAANISWEVQEQIRQNANNGTT